MTASRGPRVVRVDGPDDPVVADVAGLTDAAARRSHEAAAGVYVAEGLLVLEAVVAAGGTVRFVLCSEPRLERVLAAVGERDVTIHVAPQDVVEAVAGFPIHRGVVAAVDRPPLSDPATLVIGAQRVLVVEAVNDHENVGALFRNAAAFAVDAVLLDERCADPLYRRSVRVSLGHVLRVPWARVGSAETGMALASAAGLDIAALTPRGATDVSDLDPSRPWALVVGAEGPGLSAAALAAADVDVAVPLAPGVDSLNVATAAAVALGILAHR